MKVDEAELKGDLFKGKPMEGTYSTLNGEWFFTVRLL
jgi:hypothetical protein